MAKAEAPKSFLRDATGLVREISAFDSFVSNFAVINIPLGLVTFTSAEYIFPGGNAVYASLLATVLAIFPALVYTFLTWSMPRAGGDYVFVSRIVHPALGFMTNFGIMFWYIFFDGILANWISTLAISPSLFVIGTETNNHALMNLSNAIVQPNNTMIIGLVVVAFFSIVMLMGLRATINVTKIMIVLMLIGLAVAAGLLLTTSHSTFVADFAKFGNYNNVTSSAHAAGYVDSTSNPLYATAGWMPYIWGSIGFGLVTSYFAGEAKSVKKTALYSQVGATATAGIILAILGGLAVAVFGYDFLGSMGYLSFTLSPAYPLHVAPYYDLYVSMLTNNQVILWLLAISYIAGFAADSLIVYLIASRSVFAWSFDRVIPSRFGEISQRFRSPTFAIALIALINVIGLAIYTYFSAASTLLSLLSGSYLGFVLMFFIVMLAGISFPFVKKTLFNNSPSANYRLGRIPLITIFGVVGAGLYVLLAYFFISNPNYGANVPVVYETIILSALVPLAIFAIAYYYRRSKGLNILQAFKEIPPE
jgi:basic amino acid/polyamine antiporter, APA family